MERHQELNQYPEDLIHQINSDYRMTIRTASTETWDALVKAMIPLYRVEEKKPELSNKAEFAKSILEEAAIGSTAGLITHHPQDLLTLGEKLAELPSTWRLATIACPDYKWNRVNGSMVPDNDTLNSGIPRASEPFLRHLSDLSQRAERFGEKMEINVLFAAWEFTGNDFLPRINGGITSQQALDLLKESQNATEERISLITNGNVVYHTSLENPPNFHENAQQLAQRIMANEGRKVSAVYKVRSHFYPDGPAQAALDLAISTQGFDLAKQKGDIIAVPTSVTIARACLSGTGTPWIQYQPDYLG